MYFPCKVMNEDTKVIIDITVLFFNEICPVYQTDQKENISQKPRSTQ